MPEGGGVQKNRQKQERSSYTPSECMHNLHKWTDKQQKMALARKEYPSVIKIETPVSGRLVSNWLIGGRSANLSSLRIKM